MFKLKVSSNLIQNVESLKFRENIPLVINKLLHKHQYIVRKNNCVDHKTRKSYLTYEVKALIS
jgi:hypothetical protein